MTGKGSLPSLLSHAKQRRDEAYGFAHWAASQGSSTAYGTYSTANHWNAEGGRWARRVSRIQAALARIEARRNGR